MARDPNDAPCIMTIYRLAIARNSWYGGKRLLAFPPNIRAIFTTPGEYSQDNNVELRAGFARQMPVDYHGPRADGVGCRGLAFCITLTSNYNPTKALYIFVCYLDFSC